MVIAKFVLEEYPETNNTLHLNGLLIFTIHLTDNANASSSPGSKTVRFGCRKRLKGFAVSRQQAFISIILLQNMFTYNRRRPYRAYTRAK
jgi:hypothetical protein